MAYLKYTETVTIKDADTYRLKVAVKCSTAKSAMFAKTSTPEATTHMQSPHKQRGWPGVRTGKINPA